MGTDERAHPELQAWLAADTRHRGAFVRARAIWRIMDHDAPPIARPADSFAEPRITRRAMGAGLAASGVGLVVALNWPQPAAAVVLRTGFGQIRRFALAGGGALVLDGDSHAVVHGDAAPRLDLLAGALWVDLPQRPSPLLLRTGGLDLTASTAALALRRAPIPEAIIARGFVDLAGRDRRATQIGAGSRVRRDRDAVIQIDQVAPQALDRLLAWRTGDIDLDGETVAAAADRFNAYNRRHILIADPSLASQRVVGRFALHRPDDFADAVATMFAGRVERAAGTIRIEALDKNDRRTGG